MVFIYAYVINAGGNSLKMDKDGALNFGKVILGTAKDIKNVTLNDELGVFIINFRTSASLTENSYTAILSRFGTNRIDIKGDTKAFKTFSTNSGNYRLSCDSDGKITIYDISSNKELNEAYIEKIIKIMNY